MKEKGVVILGAGLLQKPLINAAKRRNWFVIVCDKNSGALAANEGDLFLPVSTRDASELIHALEPHRNTFHYCATLGTDMTVSMAEINKTFDLPGLKPSQAEVTTHKGKMRKFLTSIGLNQPRFFVTTEREDAIDWVNQNHSAAGYVIKPIHNMGARGVMFFQHSKELSFAFEFSQSEALTREVIIEEYIPADELSVDALSVNGMVYITGLADRNIEIKDRRFFIETGHTMPTQRQPGIYENLHNVLGIVSKELGKLTGTPYTGALKGDVRITPDKQIVIGEVATRLSGGFMSTHTFPYSSGIDLVESYLDILEGSLPEFVRQKNFNKYNNVTIERAVIASPGRVKEISFPENFQSDSAEVKDIFIHYRSTDLISSLQSNLGKTANVIISADTLDDAEKCFNNLVSNSNVKVQLEVINPRDLASMARKNFNHGFCHVCKICDGVNCASGVPGMGGVGSMNSFQDNLKSLSEVKIKYDKINLPGQKGHYSFLGKKLPLPVLNAPITGSITNMGGSITEYDLAIETAEGLGYMDLPAVYGDGADPLKYFTAIEAIRNRASGYLVIKPRKNNLEIISRIEEAEAAGADGWGIDIDAVNLVTMKLKDQQMAAKTKNDFLEICRHTKLPFFIKGIMTPEEGLEAADWGAGAIVVSNHGGRINDSLPGAARVIEDIANKVKKNFPDVQVFADGGIRSGEDILKMTSLGADGVMIGRPITIAAVAAGRLGVYSLLKTWQQEMESLITGPGLIHRDS